MRLIDAYWLMDDINRSLNEMTKIRMAVDGDWLWAKLNDALEKAPTVEPERKKGRWVTDGGRQECSVCHINFPDLYPLYDDANYCPSCGADMRGEIDDE